VCFNSLPLYKDVDITFLNICEEIMLTQCQDNLTDYNKNNSPKIVDPYNSNTSMNMEMLVKHKQLEQFTLKNIYDDDELIQEWISYANYFDTISMPNETSYFGNRIYNMFEFKSLQSRFKILLELNNKFKEFIQKIGVEKCSLTDGFNISDTYSDIKGDKKEIIINSKDAAEVLEEVNKTEVYIPSIAYKKKDKKIKKIEEDEYLTQNKIKTDKKIEENNKINKQIVDIGINFVNNYLTPLVSKYVSSRIKINGDKKIKTKDIITTALKDDLQDIFKYIPFDRKKIFVNGDYKNIFDTFSKLFDDALNSPLNFIVKIVKKLIWTSKLPNDKRVQSFLESNDDIDENTLPSKWKLEFDSIKKTLRDNFNSIKKGILKEFSKYVPIISEMVRKIIRFAIEEAIMMISSSTRNMAVIDTSSNDTINDEIASNLDDIKSDFDDVTKSVNQEYRNNKNNKFQIIKYELFNKVYNDFNVIQKMLTNSFQKYMKELSGMDNKIRSKLFSKFKTISNNMIKSYLEFVTNLIKNNTINDKNHQNASNMLDIEATEIDNLESLDIYPDRLSSNEDMTVINTIKSKCKKIWKYLIEDVSEFLTKDVYDFISKYQHNVTNTLVNSLNEVFYNLITPSNIPRQQSFIDISGEGYLEQCGEGKNKIKVSKIIKSVISSNNISTKYNNNLQEIYLTHILSYILLNNKQNITVNEHYLKKMLNEYIKNNKDNMDDNIGGYIFQLKSNLDDQVYEFDSGNEIDYESDSD
jgi:hypothetical protein